MSGSRKCPSRWRSKNLGGKSKLGHPKWVKIGQTRFFFILIDWDISEDQKFVLDLDSPNVKNSEIDPKNPKTADDFAKN